MIEKITNYADIAIDRLIHQYKNKPKLEAILKAFASEIQELENTYFDLLEKRSFDTAIGYQLDRIGVILGETRQGLNDDEYRIRLKAKVFKNTSFGEPERIITLFKLLVNPNIIHISDLELSTIIIASDYEFNSVDTLFTIINYMSGALPVTVRIDDIVTFDADAPLSLDGDSLGLGFGDDLDPLYGGKIAYDYLLDSPKLVFGNDSGESILAYTEGLGIEDDPMYGGIIGD